MSLLVGPDRADRGRPHRELQLLQRIGIANAAVDDDARQAFLQCISGCHVAPLRAGVFARACNDQNIAGLREIKRAMHHQVVAGSAIRSHRRSRDADASIERAHSCGHEAGTCAGDSHGLMQIRHGDLPRCLTKRRRHAVHSKINNGRIHLKAPAGSAITLLTPIGKSWRRSSVEGWLPESRCAERMNAGAAAVTAHAARAG